MKVVTIGSIVTQVFSQIKASTLQSAYLMIGQHVRSWILDTVLKFIVKNLSLILMSLPSAFFMRKNHKLGMV